MRRFLFLVFALLVTAGCVEEPTTGTNVTTTKTTVVTTVPATAVAKTPTPAPEAVAYISGITCGVGDRSEDAYHCNGNVRISGGKSGDLQVIVIYPDKNTFKSNIVTLGGSEDAVLKPFVVFPDVKYKGKTPAYYVKMDGKVYPVKWSGSSGTAWANLPGSEDIEIP